MTSNTISIVAFRSGLKYPREINFNKQGGGTTAPGSDGPELGMASPLTNVSTISM